MIIYNDIGSQLGNPIPVFFQSRNSRIGGWPELKMRPGSPVLSHSLKRLRLQILQRKMSFKPAHYTAMKH